MSEMINNREYRRKVLKELISELHAGKGVEDVKKRFEETFEGVSASEISEVEQALIMDGMPVSEVQRLCDVHAAVFKGSIEDIHKPQQNEKGHPLDIMKRENRAIEDLIADRIKPRLQKLAEGSVDSQGLKSDLDDLWQIDLHYQKKENILFPYLEKYGVTAPPKVMWGVDDEIRELVKKAKEQLSSGDAQSIKAAVEEAADRIAEMIFKEENILFPMMMETLSPDEWKRAADDMKEVGFCLIDGAPEMAAAQRQEEAAVKPSEGIMMQTGVLKPQELIGLLNTLPFDITFVDKDDTVKYFSQGKERIFARTKAIIGRKVTNCHPPASVHIVEGIVADLKSGKKDHENFWIRMGDKYVYIRYFAVRDENGGYLGTIEVTQDIAPIQKITGEKRLVSE